ncbi:MAG: DUF423 domain-containing protein [Bacteroidetes bacterium]|nr:DUF423 domain-containing protein [Bacteroidota bacterium]
MKPSKILTVGLMGALAVSLGALGAHFLKSKIESGLVTPDQLAGFETGVRYHMYHTIVMLIVLLWNQIKPNKWLDWAYACFFWGVILFSGSLYFLCTRGLTGFEGLKFLGPVTPIGGIVLITGWIMLAVSAFKAKE